MSEVPLQRPAAELAEDGAAEAACQRERVLYRQPTGPNPLYHRDDEVDRPRAMGV